VQVLKAKAEALLGEAIDTAVMTVPSDYNNDQRLATMDAVALCGISRVSLLQVCSLFGQLMDKL
jgi:molecular chaperone DnaK (HSP70)